VCQDGLEAVGKKLAWQVLFVVKDEDQALPRCFFDVLV
jgi:hypothetical protein